MSHIFRIGDRVRIKYSDNWPELAGTEGTVSSEPIKYFCLIAHDWRYGRDVTPDGWESNLAPVLGLFNAEAFSPRDDQIEPVQKPKSLPAEIIAMTGLPDFQIAAGECA